MQQLTIFTQRNCEHLRDVHTADGVTNQQACALSGMHITGGLHWLKRPAGLQQAGDQSSGEANAPRNNYHPKQKPDQSSEKGHGYLCNRVDTCLRANDDE
jgi:hypothetical protein